jgi:hypothetical protein
MMMIVADNIHKLAVQQTEQSPNNCSSNRRRTTRVCGRARGR